MWRVQWPNGTSQVYQTGARSRFQLCYAQTSWRVSKGVWGLIYAVWLCCRYTGQVCKQLSAAVPRADKVDGEWKVHVADNRVCMAGVHSCFRLAVSCTGGGG